MEETTAKAIEVVVVQQQPELYLCLGFIAVLLTFILFSFFFNR